MGWAKVALASALALVAVLSVFSVPVDALDRSDGDYWVYEGGMDYEGVPISGGFRYEFEAKDSLTIDSESYDVNVIKVTGSMSGEMDLVVISTSVEVVFDGFNYEVAGSLASVKDDMHIWANITVGTGSYAWVNRTESHSVTTYSPPTLSGFVEGETGTGDEWDETVTISSTATTWVDDGDADITADEHEETYSYSIAATEETITTDAGTFECLKLTETDSAGDYYSVYWYSSEVGSWVKLSMFESGDSTPRMSLELSEYGHSADDAMLAVLPWIIGVAAAVVVIAVILMVMRKRGRSPAQMDVAMPAPPPPPPTM